MDVKMEIKILQDTNLLYKRNYNIVKKIIKHIIKKNIKSDYTFKRPPNDNQDPLWWYKEPTPPETLGPRELEAKQFLENILNIQESDSYTIFKKDNLHKICTEIKQKYNKTFSFRFKNFKNKYLDKLKTSEEIQEYQKKYIKEIIETIKESELYNEYLNNKTNFDNICEDQKNNNDSDICRINNLLKKINMIIEASENSNYSKLFDFINTLTEIIPKNPSDLINDNFKKYLDNQEFNDSSNVEV